MSSLLRNLFLALLLVIGFSISLYSQVTANFSANQTSNCGSFLVQFNNLSSGAGNLSYNWDFGNGNISALQNPSTLYTTSGSYTVTLTVTNGISTDQLVLANYITVFALPNPATTANPPSGCPPLNVNFTNNTILGSAPIQTTIWDFGDGTIINANGGPVSHIFNSTGNYSITMLVTDANGCQANTTFPNIVNVNNNSPIAEFIASDTADCSQPFTISFTNQTISNGPVNYIWNFGDGTSSNQINPTHTYASSGNWDITLTATYPTGCGDVRIKNNYISTVSQVSTDFEASSTSVCARAPITFTNTSSQLPQSVIWNFGDGTTSNQLNPIHSYQNPGTYTVKLVNVYGINCRDSITQQNYIFVSPSPNAGFTANPTNSCTVPLIVNFTNLSTGTGPLTYQWNFFPGGSTQTNPNRTYNNAGVYDVRLITTNSIGCKDTLRRDDYIVTQPPVVNFGINSYSPCIPAQVSFTDSTISPIQISSWLWNFGDGQTSSQQNPSHTYSIAGSYAVSLTVTNSTGCSQTYVSGTNVVVSNRPSVNFSTTNTNVCAGNPVLFNNQSTNANQWQWLLDNLPASALQNPNLTFTDTGLVTVTLIASNNGCSDSLRRVNYVNVQGPINRFVFTKDCNSPLSISFNDTSILADTYFWNFGDGTTSNLPDPQHDFSANGVYTITHTVTNQTTGCSYTRVQNITIGDFNTTFTATTPTSGCAPFSVNFQLTGTGITNRSWRFGDGTTSNLLSPTHIYSEPGSYTVTLIVRYGNCRDTIIIPNYINVSGPQTRFAFDTLVSCDSIFATFTDSTTSFSPISTWNWNFGDGGTSNLQNPTHSFLSTGTYPISLTVTDNVGCSVTYSDTTDVVINAIAPPNFSVTDLKPCPGQSITFSPIVLDTTGLTYQWSFGDGGTSFAMNPIHSYQSAGSYDVSLLIRNSSGCTSTLILQDYISIVLPISNFIVAPSSASCPPLLANFTPISTPDVIGWNWDFDDGSSSTLQNPGHLYTLSGYFDVSLIVTDTNGCEGIYTLDTAVSVNGPFGTFTFTPDTIGCPPFEIIFTANTFNTTNFTWDFGDGFIGNGQTVTHLYQNLGDYVPNLLLSNQNTGCSFTILGGDSIRIAPLQVSAGSDVSICMGETVELSASGGNGFIWTPGLSLDNDTVMNPKATPDTTTLYIVTVTKGLCSNSDTVEVEVKPLPFPAFTVAPVCFGDTSFFINNTTNDTLGSTYSWTLDQGVFSSDTNPTYIYDTYNNYRVTLIVNSENGCSDTAISNAFVYAVPTVNASAIDGCFQTLTQFEGNLSIGLGSIDSIFWDFGDGNVSNVPNPSNLYSTIDTFQVSVTAISNQSCSVSDSLSVIIHANPVAIFTQSFVCRNDTSAFIDISTISSDSIVNWNWDMGDGNFVNSQQNNYVYQQSGNYSVILTTTSNYGCSDTATAIYTIYPLPQAAFQSQVDSACVSPVNVQFINQSNGATQYQWDFGNGQTSASTGGIANYATPGTYTIELLSISQYGCLDSITAPFTVYPTPTADFTVSNTVGCNPFFVTFENLSVNANQFSWGLNDNTFSDEFNPTNNYYTAGSYSIWLTVTGAGECKDSVNKANYLTVLQSPTANFNYGVITKPLVDGTVLFSNTSIGGISNNWILGDGALSNAIDTFRHKYDDWGTIPVTLITTAENGCQDSITKQVKVQFFGGIFVPDALVLDGDGEFGIFLPKGKGIKNYRLTIFDKWGNLIFESTALEGGSPTEGWNGEYAGEPVQLGAYTWRIIAEMENNEFWVGKEYGDKIYTDNGTVTVLR